MYHRIVLCTALALTCQSQAENTQYQVNANYNDSDVEQGGKSSNHLTVLIPDDLTRLR